MSLSVSIAPSGLMSPSVMFSTPARTYASESWRPIPEPSYRCQSKEAWPSKEVVELTSACNQRISAQETHVDAQNKMFIDYKDSNTRTKSQTYRKAAHGPQIRHLICITSLRPKSALMEMAADLLPNGIPKYFSDESTRSANPSEPRLGKFPRLNGSAWVHIVTTAARNASLAIPNS